MTILKQPFIEKNIKGKPYITVSPKGIANGLSDIPNDGADFGPDTMLNATDPSQIGAPYTQTSGIQEALNYVENIAISTLNPFNKPTICLLPGWFTINDNATIWINNDNSVLNPYYYPNGLHICGAGELTWIVKQNSLTSPILSFTVPFGTSGTSALNQQGHMIFENFGVLYNGSPSNASSNITMVNLSIPETGGTMSVFRNLFIWSPNPINNTLLDLSGNEDSTVDNVYVNNSGGSYNPSITVPPLKMYCIVGNVNMYRVLASGIDIEAQNANIINSTIGTCAGPGIIFRPSYYGGAILNLEGTYFNGCITRLITIQPEASTGYTNPFQVNLRNTILIKNSVGNTDYMIEPYSSMYGLWDFTEAMYSNGNTSYSLYMFDPNVSFNIQNEFINLYTHSTSNKYNIILITENSTPGTTAGTVKMSFITYTLTYKKLMVYFSGYENNTTTNQTINFPIPFLSYAIITGNNTGLTISASTTSITITSPNSTTTYSGLVIIEGY
jgi:hypothetical protein